MWKNLKGYFIIDDEADKTKGNASSRQGVVKPAAPQPTSTAPAAAQIDTSGAVNDKFVKVLMEAMEKANLPGFDYLEYKKSLQNLKKMNFADDVRYQTAFAAAQSMGVTPADLLKSAEHYLVALNKEQSKFDQALSGQQSQQVSSKQQRLKDLDASIAQQEAKIKELQGKIKKTRTEQQQLKTSILNNEGKLAKTKADFQATFKVIAESIKLDVTNIKNFLK